MKKKKYYYNHRFPIDGDLKAWLEYKDFYHTAWKWHFSVKRFYGIELQPKHRHRRSMLRIDMVLLPGDTAHYTFTREAKVIGRKKHGKWLYMPKRILLGGNN